jgi:hypothetical protein
MMIRNTCLPESNMNFPKASAEYEAISFNILSPANAGVPFRVSELIPQKVY